MQLAERRPSMESNEAQYLFTESELNELIAYERAAEREACAKLIDIPYFGEGGKECAEAIRARGQK